MLIVSSHAKLMRQLEQWPGGAQIPMAGKETRQMVALLRTAKEGAAQLGSHVKVMPRPKPLEFDASIRFDPWRAGLRMITTIQGLDSQEEVQSKAWWSASEVWLRTWVIGICMMVWRIRIYEM